MIWTQTTTRHWKHKVTVTDFENHCTFKGHSKHKFETFKLEEIFH